MNTREIKEHLAEAKKCLGKCDFMGAVKHCKAILKEDENNYNALIFLGKAYHEDRKDQQCREVLSKAVKINPSQITAWHGLIKHYERVDKEPSQELITAYRKVSEFYEKDTSQEDKYLETQLKFASALLSKEEYGAALKCLDRLVKKVAINVDVVKLLLRLFDIKNFEGKKDYQHLEEMALRYMIHDKPTDRHLKRYTALLFQSKNTQHILTECLALEHTFNLFYHPIELLVRTYFESESFDYPFAHKIPEWVRKLLNLNPSSKFGHLALGKMYFHIGNYPKAIGALSDGLENSFNLKGHQMLVESLIKLWDFDKGERLALQALNNPIGNKFEKKCKDQVMRKLQIQAKLGRVFVNCIERDGDDGTKGEMLAELKELFVEYQGLEFAQEGALDLFQAKYHLLAKEYDLMEPFLKGIEDQEVSKDPEIHLLKILAQNQGPEESKNAISGLTMVYESDFELLLTSAMYLFYLNEISDASDLFSKIISMYPDSPVPYFYLSKLQIGQKRESEALLNLAKAFGLYPCSEYGLILTDLYAQQENWDEYLKILSKCSKLLKDGDCKWAQFRLAIYMLQEEEVDKAIFAFQNILKKDFNDGSAWENIAEAYLERGSYLSARRAYGKALEFGRDKVFCLYKIGVIHRNLLEFEESIASLSQVSEIFPPALFELSLAYFDQAKDFASKHSDSSFVEAVNNGIASAFRSIQKASNNIQGWLLLGEFTLLIKILPKSTIFRVPAPLVNLQNETFEEIEVVKTQIGLVELLLIGTLCLEKAVQVIQDDPDQSILLQSYALTALSKSYYFRALISPDSERKKLLEEALQYAQYSVMADDRSALHWNHLGIVAQAIKNYPLAVHAFINSIELNPASIITWSNLGTVYLLQKDYNEAYNIYTHAQTINPRYAPTWIGLAFIAEQIKPGEALDLFRHTSQMDDTKDIALIRFIEKLLSNMSDKEREEQLSLGVDLSYYIDVEDGYTKGLDLVSRYIARNPQDIEAINYKGILALLKGLKGTAEDCFRQALKLCDEKEANEVISLNLAIALEEQGDLEGAMKMLGSIKKRSLKVCATEASIYKKTGDFAEAFGAYNEMLKQKDCSKKEALYAMIGLALTLEKINGFEKARDKLIESHEIDTGVIDPLLVTCSLALLNNRIDIVQSTLISLASFEGNPDHLADIAFLRACGLVIQGEIDSSRYAFTRQIHLYPRNPRLWSYLSEHLVRFTKNEGKDARSVRQCIESAMKLGQRSGCDDLSLVAYSALMSADFDEAIFLAQRAVRLYSHVPKTWAILAAAIFNKCKRTRNTRGVVKACQIARNALTMLEIPDGEIKDWFQELEESATSFLEELEQEKGL